MQADPKLLIAQIQDPYLRKNFEALANYFSAQNQLLDFNFFEVEFTAAETGRKVAHGLPYIPLDIIVTHCVRGNVTFDYDAFDETHMILNSSAACRVRFFAGTYAKKQTTLQIATGDEQTVNTGG
jgi:hypothetical protein